MASTSEKGHAKNVANFKDLISYCTSFGAIYNPSRAALTLASLNTLQTNAENLVAALNTAMPAYNTAVAIKDQAFAPLSKLVTKAFNHFSSSGALPGEIDMVFTMAKKIKGQTTKTEKAKQAEETGKDPVSQSQLSMDMRIENFDKFIKMLEANTTYTPNETELQIASLQALLAQLKTLSEAVVTAEGPVIGARSKRDAVLYADTNGLVDIAKDVKKYVRSVFPANSTQYKKVVALTFAKPRKK